MLLSVLLVIIWVVIATIADVFFKQAGGSMWNRYFAIGQTLYCSTSYLAIYVFHKQQFGWTILMWNGMSLLLSILLAVFWFHEPLTAKRVLAFVLVLIAMFLTEST